MKNQFYTTWSISGTGETLYSRSAKITIWHPDVDTSVLPPIITIGQFDKSGRFIPTNSLDPWPSDIEQIWELDYLDEGTRDRNLFYVKEYFCDRAALDKFLEERDVLPIFIYGITLMGFNAEGKMIPLHKAPTIFEYDED